MDEPIKIDPQVLHQVGKMHDQVADHIATARQAGPEIGAAVSSFGPIMHELKAAVADILTDREAALLDHESVHRNTADALRVHAAAFADQEAINTERLQF